MSSYKYLIFSDLDGTLLKDSGELSQETIDYVRELNKREDVLFGFITGRTWDDSKFVFEQLQLKGFVACCNGAHLFEPKKQLNVYSFISRKAWEAIFSNEEFFVNFAKANILTDKGHFIIKTSEERVNLLKKLIDEDINVFDLKVYYSKDIVALEDLDERLNFLKAFSVKPKTTIFSYEVLNLWNIEIQVNYVSKEYALMWISSFYGIAPENVISFGDQVNDISMAIGKSSRFVAVKNAISLLKQCSDHISQYTNEEHGVIKETEEFLRSKEKSL